MKQLSVLVLGVWYVFILGCGGEGGKTSDVVSGTIEIAAGAEVTASRAVDVTLSSDGAASVTLGETADLSDGKTLTFAKTLSWELSEGNGDKTLYARFANAAGE